MIPVYIYIYIYIKAMKKPKVLFIMGNKKFKKKKKGDKLTDWFQSSFNRAKSRKILYKTKEMILEMFSVEKTLGLFLALIKFCSLKNIYTYVYIYI